MCPKENVLLAIGSRDELPIPCRKVIIYGYVEDMELSDTTQVTGDH